MDRAFSSGASGTPPTAPASPSIGYPSPGNAGTGTPATKPGPWWYHMITEELLAIITGSGLTPAQGTLTQLASAIQSGKLYTAAAAGTADAITASFTPAVTATTLANGMSLFVRAASANATTTPTFTPNSGVIAAKTIVKGAGIALAANDIAGAGHWIELQYDLSLDKWVLLNPATGIFAPSQATVQGLAKNLRSSATGLNANISVSIDELVVESASNLYQILRNVSLTVTASASGANGLDTGTLAASTIYYLWVIWNGTLTAGLLSLSSTAPTLPGGYTHKARIGCIVTDGTANKYPYSFVQNGRRFQYKVASGSNLTALLGGAGVCGSVTTPTYLAFSTASIVPSTAQTVRLVIGTGNTNNGVVIAAPNASYGAYTSSSNPPPINLNTAGTTGAVLTGVYDLVVESANIYIASNISTASFQFLGWEDSINA